MFLKTQTRIKNICTREINRQELIHEGSRTG